MRAARELVAQGDQPTAVALVAQVSRQAIYKTRNAAQHPQARGSNPRLTRRLSRSRRHILAMGLGWSRLSPASSWVWR